VGPHPVGVLGQLEQTERELARLAGQQRDPDGPLSVVVAVGEDHRDVLQPSAALRGSDCSGSISARMSV
jgi:hypothetical protein